MAEVGFRGASGGTKTLLVLLLVGVVAWLALSGVFVFVMTALGIGNCDCPERAATAFIGSIAVHVVAIVAVVVVVFRTMGMTPRILTLVVIALGVPVATLVGSFLVVSSGQG